MEHLTNTEILCFVLGWQGGTVHQVVEVMNKHVFRAFYTPKDIIQASPTEMRQYCRLAQQIAKGEI